MESQIAASFASSSQPAAIELLDRNDLGCVRRVKHQLGRPGWPGDAQRRVVWIAVLGERPTLPIIADDSSRRPGRLAVLLVTLANSEGPKLPNTKGRSNACAAP